MTERRTLVERLMRVSFLSVNNRPTSVLRNALKLAEAVYRIDSPDQSPRWSTNVVLQAFFSRARLGKIETFRVHKLGHLESAPAPGQPALTLVQSPLVFEIPSESVARISIPDQVDSVLFDRSRGDRELPWDQLDTGTSFLIEYRISGLIGVISQEKLEVSILTSNGIDTFALSEVRLSSPTAAKE